MEEKDSLLLSSATTTRATFAWNDWDCNSRATTCKHSRFKDIKFPTLCVFNSTGRLSTISCGSRGINMINLKNESIAYNQSGNQGESTVSRVEKEKDFSRSAPNSAFPALLRSLPWQHFSAKRNNVVERYSSGPTVSNNTRNNLLIRDMKSERHTINDGA